MRKQEVKTVDQALAYITDCCLATVCDMAMASSQRKRGEFKRQILIAQAACDWMAKFEVDPSSTRAEDIIGKQTVEEWAMKFYKEKV